MSLLKVNEVQNYNGSSLTLTASTVSTSAQLNTGGNVSVTGSINVSDDSTTRSNLGLGTISTQAANSVDIDGGAIDGTTIGGSSAAAGTFTTFTSTGIDDNASSTALTIDASGDVKIYEGATVVGSVSGFTGGELILGDTTASTQNSISTVATGTPITFFDHRGTSTGSWIFRSSASTRMTIDSSGNVNIPGLSASSDVQTDASKNLITTSDARLKNDLGVITDSAINVVQQIIPKYFSWKNDESNSQQLGFFAQDVYPVLPEAAPRALKYIEVGKDENSDPILEQVLDEEGNPDYEWGFTDRPIIAMCVKAIQEQQALIESQQSQIDGLTARIEALETT